MEENKNIIQLKDIVIQDMKTPTNEKLQKYYSYYDINNEFAHPIICNKDGILIDGYCTYLIAKETNISLIDKETFDSKELFEKCIIGNHVKNQGNIIIDCNQRMYCWSYRLVVLTAQIDLQN